MNAKCITATHTHTHTHLTRTDHQRYKVNAHVMHSKKLWKFLDSSFNSLFDTVCVTSCPSNDTEMFYLHSAQLIHTIHNKTWQGNHILFRNLFSKKTLTKMLIFFKRILSQCTSWPVTVLSEDSTKSHTKAVHLGSLTWKCQWKVHPCASSSNAFISVMVCGCICARMPVCMSRVMSCMCFVPIKVTNLNMKLPSVYIYI